MYMTGRINQNFNTFQRTADLGGREILGLNGSLTHWVNTGNYKPDTFSSADNKAKEKKSKFSFSKILTACSFLIASGVGVYYLFKSGKLNKFKDTISGVIDSLKQKFLKAGNNASSGDVNNIAGKINSDKVAGEFNSNKTADTAEAIADEMQEASNKEQNFAEGFGSVFAEINPDDDKILETPAESIENVENIIQPDSFKPSGDNASHFTKKANDIIPKQNVAEDIASEQKFAQENVEETPKDIEIKKEVAEPTTETPVLMESDIQAAKKDESAPLELELLEPETLTSKVDKVDEVVDESAPLELELLEPETLTSKVDVDEVVDESAPLELELSPEETIYKIEESNPDEILTLDSELISADDVENVVAPTNSYPAFEMSEENKDLLQKAQSAKQLAEDYAKKVENISPELDAFTAALLKRNQESLGIKIPTPAVVIPDTSSKTADVVTDISEEISEKFSQDVSSELIHGVATDADKMADETVEQIVKNDIIPEINNAKAIKVASEFPEWNPANPEIIEKINEFGASRPKKAIIPPKTQLGDKITEMSLVDDYLEFRLPGGMKGIYMWLEKECDPFADITYNVIINKSDVEMLNKQIGVPYNISPEQLLKAYKINPDKIKPGFRYSFKFDRDIENGVSKKGFDVKNLEHFITVLKNEEGRLEYRFN